MKQLSFVEKPPKQDNPDKRLKRNWEYGFQRWSDYQSIDGHSPLGKCGYSKICYYCKDNCYGRPCVRALNAMCRANKITIDYTNKNYQEIWEL